MSGHFSEEDVESSENIIWDEQPHYASQIGAIAVGLLLIPVGGIGLVVLSSIYVQLKYTSYALTDKAVYHKRGLFSNKTRRVPLEQIQDSEYTISWVEKQFGYGTVGISSAGSSGTDIQFRAVPNPKEVSHEIDSLSDKRKQQTSQSNQNQPRRESNEELAKELRATRENLEQVIEILK
jgi:uncharacterized membrane protein YdbT with pleckstrin-like domain